MRIAPLGAIYRADSSMLERVVFEATYTTHADVRAVSLALAVAACCAWLIAGLSEDAIRVELPGMLERFEASLKNLDGVQVEDPAHYHAVSSVIREVLARRWPSLDDFRGWLQEYARQHFSDTRDLELIPNHPFVLLGGIHALVAGLWPNSTPDALLADVVRQGGDADTVGAMTGAILGARYGADWIPADRLMDGAALSAYADSLTGGELPESFTDFIQRESRWSSMDRDFRHRAGLRLRAEAT